MLSKIIILYVMAVCTSCDSNENYTNEKNLPVEIMAPQLNENPFKFINEIPLPSGFSRLKYGDNSYAAWLENLPLKRNKTVYLFNGRAKLNQQAQYAVLNISVGKQDLQQCADAVMRLRAEYLYERKNYSAIIFKDNNGTVYKFTPPYTRDNFDKYLNRVFAMCGSASLSKQLKPVPFQLIKAGDILIKGGFPGHAVMVMDIAENQQGERIYLLAQSYMPAQDIHVLINPLDKKLSPWYKVNDELTIQTPEYYFTQSDLKSF
ncbi:MAG: DUF4846 domain-containing protein [Ferruginibacter sp.]